MFFVDDDQPKVAEGKEQGRAGTRRQAAPRLRPTMRHRRRRSVIVDAGMPFRRAARQTAPRPGSGIRPSARSPATGPAPDGPCRKALGHGFQVNLGLAGSGHALQQASPHRPPRRLTGPQAPRPRSACSSVSANALWQIRVEPAGRADRAGSPLPGLTCCLTSPLTTDEVTPAVLGQFLQA